MPNLKIRKKSKKLNRMAKKRIRPNKLTNRAIANLNSLRQITSKMTLKSNQKEKSRKKLQDRQQDQAKTGKFSSDELCIYHVFFSQTIKVTKFKVILMFDN